MPHLSLPFVFYFVLSFVLRCEKARKPHVVCLRLVPKSKSEEKKTENAKKAKTASRHHHTAQRYSTAAAQDVQKLLFNLQMTNSHSRHKRTHDRGDGADGLNLSGEDEEEYSGEDLHGSIGDASPNSEGGYVTTSLNSVANSINTPPTSHGSMGSSNSNHMTTSQPHYNSLQTLSMPMSITTPQQMNTAVMM